jgi:hypothetical protein
MAALLEDLRVLRGYLQSDQHENTIVQIERLVQRGQAEVHTYMNGLHKDTWSGASYNKAC